MAYIYIHPILIILQSHSGERGMTSYNSMKGGHGPQKVENLWNKRTNLHNIK